MQTRPAAVVAAAIVTTFAMGSIHAFSVLGVAMEEAFNADRAAVSGVYSLALVSLTTAVLLSPNLYARFAPVSLLAAAFAVSIAGLAVSASATALWQVVVAYGIVFGAANGVAYGLSLTLGAAANPQRKGLIMSVVTASYAIGAAVAAQGLGLAVAAGGAPGGFRWLLVALLAAGLLATVLARVGAPVLPGSPDATAGRVPARLTAVLWVSYGAAVFAGLMATGHAAGLVQAQGAPVTQFATAAMLIALGNAAGGFAAAGIADRWPVQRLLVLLPLCCVGGLLILRWMPGVESALAGLTLVGFGYGATIAAYPPCIARVVGLNAYPRVYGRVFTAWGAAGLVAPWLAGWLFTAGGDYRLALDVASGLAVLSVAAVCIAGTRVLRPSAA